MYILFVCFSVNCSPGYYISNGKCTVCMKGYYQSEYNKTSCTGCPANHDTMNTGSTNSKDCTGLFLKHIALFNNIFDIFVIYFFIIYNIMAQNQIEPTLIQISYKSLFCKYNYQS